MNYAIIGAILGLMGSISSWAIFAFITQPTSQQYDQFQINSDLSLHYDKIFFIVVITGAVTWLLGAVVERILPGTTKR